MLSGVLACVPSLGEKWHPRTSRRRSRSRSNAHVRTTAATYNLKVMHPYADYRVAELHKFLSALSQ